MNEQFLLYLWSISEEIKIGAFLSGVIGSTLFFIIAGFLSQEGNDKQTFCALGFAVFFFLHLPLQALIPSKQDLALIWAYPTVKQGVVSVVNNKEVMAVPDKIVKLANKYLDEELKKK